ncbi:MAG: DUF1848 domain-containing protein [Prevotella sp.]|jgi:DNA repair photolyase|nr:DUF1848 domain-containing protein [Prevotella sp.]MCH4183315.1 DUF1848 domain-containing protein [Prevotella sp.]MCH4242103.1 DUF1848 domain-containing protein [Prevotella sp.]
MIISASRRTDIPAFYSEWFFNRIKAGFLDVRNPMSFHRVSRISLNPEVIDCIVFWSKNPKPMLRRLDELKDYQYYFQYTINPYDKHIEKSVPLKTGIIDTFKKLSDRLGDKKVVWRYDPILLSEHSTVKYHLEYFEELAKRLSGYTRYCVVSFIDLYKKTERNIKGTSIREPNELEMRFLAKNIVDIANVYNIKVVSCSEAIDLSREGIGHGHCVDQALIEEIIGYKIDAHKDKYQRKECGCIESIDIGQYNTCLHNCVYCYANFNKRMVSHQVAMHNNNSSLLIGDLTDEDVVKKRKMYTLKDNRYLF